MNTTSQNLQEDAVDPVLARANARTYSDIHAAGGEPAPGQRLVGTGVFDRRESVVRSYCRSLGAVLTRASGSLMRDESGGEWIDFLAGAGSLNYGHNHPVLRDALLDYIAGDGIAQSLDLHTGAKRAFLEAFESIVLSPRGLPHRVQFTGPTGTNAVEAALKLARLVTGRSSVAAFTNAFHGASLGSLSVTGNATMRMADLQPLSRVTRLPYDGYFGPDVDTAVQIERELDDPSSGVDLPAAIIVEVVQGEGGLSSASGEWLRRIAALARRHGCLLIVDDIQAGCGRTGDFFSFEQAGIVPDLVVLSKSISGLGLPMSLLLIAPEYDQWTPGQHNGTFRGNDHAFVTARAALEHFWSTPLFALDVARRADVVQEALGRVAERIPGATVKGRGLMVGVDVRDPDLAARIRVGCLARGLLLETCGPRDEVVKLLPPLTTEDDLLAEGLRRLEEAAEEAVRS